MKKTKISTACNNEWTVGLIDEYYKILHEIAVDEWGYNIYPNQLEIVNSEGMLEAYASVGLPIMYPHWSFGKEFVQNQHAYKRGRMGLAYEMIINSDPCISYLMEENTMTMQTLVMAHAAFGHNHFFKNNYLFKQWTMADYIIDYLMFARRFVERCEDRYGMAEVEFTLDAAHAINSYSVDKYERKHKRKSDVEEERLLRLKWEEQHYDPLLLTEFDKNTAAPVEDETSFEPTENILYFLEKHAPELKDWQRELVRIVRKVGQYFYPQRFTQLMNEGCATYTHITLVEELDKRGLVDEAFMLEFCHMHSGVVMQPNYNDKRFSGRFNPYKLGSEMFRDMKRICEEPTREDEEWFPHLVGKPFRKEFFHAVENYKDESFVLQYLSPKLMRDFRMFTLFDGGPDQERYKISAIHDEQGYRKIRETLAHDWDMSMMMPQISVHDVKWRDDRRLVLRHHMRKGRALDQASAMRVLEHIHHLWQYPVEIHSVDEDGEERSKHIYKGVNIF